MHGNNKLYFLDKLILMYFIFQILFLRWFNGKSYFNYISIILIFIIIMRKKNNFKIIILDIVFCSIYIFTITMNLTANGIKPLIINNLYTEGIANLIAIIYIITLSYKNKQGLKYFILKDLFLILNIYFIINVPIIIKQLDNTYFLMRNIDTNPLYIDHITGLIGASGTHEMTFYWIVLVLINLYKYSQTKNKIIPILTSTYVIFMFIISSQNDNTAFFILFPMVIGQYFIKDIVNKKNIIIKIVKAALAIVVIGSIGVYIYDNNEKLNTFVNNRVLSKIEQFGLANRNVTSSDSDEERIALFKTALEVGNGYKLGTGIGSIQSYGDPHLPAHFGMSEISLRTYEGGIIYLAILILIFSHFLNGIFTIKIKKYRIISFIIISCNVTFMSIYTQIFRQPFYSFALSLIIFIFSQHYNDQEIIGH